MKIKLKSSMDFQILLIKKGFTQRGLGRAAEVSDTTISHLIGNKKGCGPEIAQKLCNALQVNFDDYFFIDIDDKSNQGRNNGCATGTDG